MRLTSGMSTAVSSYMTPKYSLYRILKENKVNNNNFFQALQNCNALKTSLNDHYEVDFFWGFQKFSHYTASGHRGLVNHTTNTWTRQPFTYCTFIYSFNKGILLSPVYLYMHVLGQWEEARSSPRTQTTYRLQTETLLPKKHYAPCFFLLMSELMSSDKHFCCHTEPLCGGSL